MTDLDTSAPAPAAADAGPGLFAGRHRISEGILADALQQAIPYRGDQDAAGRAWSARLDAAIQGLDVVDPAAVDLWMTAHAESPQPHLAEAEIVGAWETFVQDFYAYADGQEPPADVATAIAADDDNTDVGQLSITAYGEPGSASYEEAVWTAYLDDPDAFDDEDGAGS